jgi:cytochrome b
MPSDHATAHDQTEGGEAFVWDRFVRLFHWATAALVAVAFIVDDRAVHEAAGLTVLPLVGLRILWGFGGPAHARFSDFVAHPTAVIAYLRALRGGHPPRYLGHNPAGGAMVLALLALLLLTASTGWLSETDRFFGVEWISGLHGAVANLLLAAIALHVTGVLASSLLHRENLVRAMLTGRKPARIPPRQPQPERRTAAVTRLHPH